MDCRVLDVGDTALTVEFGERIEPAWQAAVAALDAALARSLRAGLLPGVVEVVPTFRSVTVIYDPLRTARSVLETEVLALLDNAGALAVPPGRHWRLPVCYGDCEAGFGQDLPAFAAACGCSPEALVSRHAAQDYRVYMLGFLPGFPFMGDLPPALAQPRRTEPRLRVPAGSVAVAGTLTAIYPWESPGGWHLLGRCPVPLFSPDWRMPALLSPGDRVGFYPVDLAEYRALEKRLASHAACRMPPLEFLLEGGGG